MMELAELNKALSTELVFKEIGFQHFIAKDNRIQKSLKVEVTNLVPIDRNGYRNFFFKDYRKYFTYRPEQIDFADHERNGFYLDGYCEFLYPGATEKAIKRVVRTLNRRFDGRIQILPELPCSDIYKLLNLGSIVTGNPERNRTLKITGCTKKNHQDVYQQVVSLLEQENSSGTFEQWSGNADRWLLEREEVLNLYLKRIYAYPSIHYVWIKAKKQMHRFGLLIL